MWETETKSIFKRQYKLLGSQRQKKVDDAIMDLVTSSDPAKKGDYKPSLGVWAYELGKSDRLIYYIRYHDSVIELRRVCDHKSAYGRG